MNMNSKKTEIPTIVVEEARTSLRARIKSAAKRAMTAVKSAVTTATVATKNAVTVVARKVRALASTSWTKASIAWRKALRPVLKTWSAWTAACTWVVALLVAPAVVVTTTLLVGAAIVGLAYALERYESRVGRLARVIVTGIKLAVHVARIAYYVATGVMLALSMLVSPLLALLFVCDLALTAVTGSSFMSTRRQRETTSREASVDLDVPTVTRNKAKQSIPVIPAAVAPKSKAIRALGAEEMFDMNACEACGTIEGTLRVRSAHVPFATAGNIGAVEESERPMLCSECFDAECEDIALSLTGVSLKARNVELRLTERGLTTLPQFASSIENTDTLFWTTTATAWWRDRKGDNHERAWSCFHGGKVVATVTFAHRNRTFVATVRGKVIGSQRSLVGAKALANDILMDERNASAVFVEALGGIAEASA